MQKFKIGDFVHEGNLVYQIIGFGGKSAWGKHYKVRIIEGDEDWEYGEETGFSIKIVDQYDYAYSYMATKQFDEDLKTLLEDK